MTRYCYIDCTGTFLSGFTTGIQRVVRNIVSQARQHEYFHGIRFVPVISIGSQLYAVPDDLHAGYYVTRCANRLLGAGWNLLEHLFSGVKVENTQNVTVHYGQLSGFRNAFIKFCRKILPYFLRLPPYVDTILSRAEKICIQSDDVFFLVDCYWNVNSYSASKRAKNNGAKVILFIHDILPLTHPRFFDDTTVYLFNDYFYEYLELADGLIANSIFTMNEVARQCERLGFNNNFALDYAYLGADFHSRSPANEVEKCAPEAQAADSCFLIVGTIEPRKNHLLVIEAFERLWESGVQIRLDIVGRIGWKSAHILKRITGSRFFNKRLFFHENLDDDDLCILIDNASAVILASTAEGFGLPLIEAMYKEKTVLASDIPVFREIAGDYPIYFSLDDVTSLMEKVSLVAQGVLGGRSIGKRWISWDESVRTLFHKVIAMAGHRE